MIPTTVGMLFPIYIDEKIRSKLFCKSGQKKSSLVSKKQNKKTKQKQEAKETKEEKRIFLENLTGYDDFVYEFTLCIFNLHTHFQEQK